MSPMFPFALRCSGKKGRTVYMEKNVPGGSNISPRPAELPLVPETTLLNWISCKRLAAFIKNCMEKLSLPEYHGWWGIPLSWGNFPYINGASNGQALVYIYKETQVGVWFEGCFSSVISLSCFISYMDNQALGKTMAMQCFARYISSVHVVWSQRQLKGSRQSIC